MKHTDKSSKYITATKKYFYFFVAVCFLFSGSMLGIILVDSLQGKIIIASLTILIFCICTYKGYKAYTFSGIISQELHLHNSTDVLELVEQKIAQTNLIENELIELLEKLSKKQYQLHLSHLFKESKLNASFSVLCQELERSEKTLEAQNWIAEGESKFTHLLQDNLNSEIETSASIFLSQLINYIQACQGLIYLVKEDESSGYYFQKIASYAHNDSSPEIIKRGEGLLGHAMFENKIQIYDNVPEEYVTVTSGLGNGTARTLTIIPVFHNSKPVCAIELILFKELTQIEVLFLQKVAGILGGIFESMISAMRTKQLLQSSEKAALELRENEMELLQHKEKLTTAQEQLNSKLIELQTESACIVSAINKSNASLELDMNGNVLHANPMFLSAMGYSLEEILGKHESIMLSEQEASSEKYNLIWESLSLGNFITGEFIRIASSGKEVWLDATYNPIVDQQGKPYKIIMYATFTTEVKEKEHEFRNKLAIINESCAFLEINIDGTIRNSNQKFLDIMKLKRKDLKGLSFNSLISIQENQLNGSKVFLEQYPSDKPLKGHLYIKDLQTSVHEFHATVMANKDLSSNVTGYMVILNPWTKQDN